MNVATPSAEQVLRHIRETVARGYVHRASHLPAAADAHGDDVEPESPRAVAWSLDGALCDARRTLECDESEIDLWLDHPRTQDDALRLLDAAIEHAKEEPPR